MKRGSRQLYRKLQIVYSAVLVCVVGILVLYSISAARRQAQETNLEYMRMAGTEARDYILQAEDNADHFLSGLYNAYSELEDLRHYLSDDVENYMKYRLDSYGSNASVAYSGIEDFMSSMFGSYSQLKNIRLYSLEQGVMTYYEADGTNRRESLTEEQAQLCAEAAQKKDGSGEVLCFRKDLRDPVSLRKIGWVELGFSGQRFLDIVEFYEKAQLVVCNSQNEAVFCSDAALTWDPKSSIGEMEKMRGVHVWEEIAGQYRIVTLLTKKDAAHISIWRFIAILAVGIGLTALGEAGICLYLSGIMNRLEAIVKGMEAVKTGDLNTRINVREKGDELDIIANSFNQMCRDLDLYIQKSYLAEIEQKNAEMAALQSQINPHFLYNTLEAIRMKAICNGDREVGKMLYSMAALFQSQLKEADVIPLAQELYYGKKYMELFEYRYHGKFTWEMNCGDEFLQIPVIKFVIQPVLENYFAHGIRLEAEDNCVRVSVKAEGPYVLILVEDNGRGMDEKVMAEKNAAFLVNELDVHKSMGLGNVNRRLRAVYGEPCGIALSRGSLGALCVTLKLLRAQDVPADGKA